MIQESNIKSQIPLKQVERVSEFDIKKGDGVIYKIASPTGRVYIGQSIDWISRKYGI